MSDKPPVIVRQIGKLVRQLCNLDKKGDSTVHKKSVKKAIKKAAPKKSTKPAAKKPTKKAKKGGY